MDRTHDPTAAPVLSPPNVASSPQSATYYRDSGVSVTDTWLVVAGSRYAVAQLANPRTVSGSRNSVVRGAAVVSGAFAVIILLIGRYLSTAGWIGAAIVLAVPLVVLAGELLRTQRRYELWAEYRGLTVRLLCEDDAERYGKIVRALALARH